MVLEAGFLRPVCGAAFLGGSGSVCCESPGLREAWKRWDRTCEPWAFCEGGEAKIGIGPHVGLCLFRGPQQVVILLVSLYNQTKGGVLKRDTSILLVFLSISL